MRKILWPSQNIQTLFEIANIKLVFPFEFHNAFQRMLTYEAPDDENLKKLVKLSEPETEIDSRLVKLRIVC